MSDPTARALRLLSLLQTHRFWTGAELVDRLGVSARTVRRDVDRLRELGYPVDATPGAGGGYQLAKGSALPPLLLDDDEAVAVAVGLRTAAGGAIAGIEETSVRAMAKLEQVLPDRLRRRVNAIHHATTNLAWGGTDGNVDPEALALLAQACRDHEEVRFDYVTRDGDESRRLVEPHQLVCAGRRWYLVAYDTRRADWRTFRVDRLAEPRLAGVRFPSRAIPAGSYAELVSRSIAGAPERFVVEVTATASTDDVRALAPLRDAGITDLGDGRVVVRIGTDSLDWLVMEVALLAAHFAIDLPALDGPVGTALVAVGTRLR